MASPLWAPKQVKSLPLRGPLFSSSSKWKDKDSVVQASHSGDKVQARKQMCSAICLLRLEVRGQKQ